MKRDADTEHIRFRTRSLPNIDSCVNGDLCTQFHEQQLARAAEVRNIINSYALHDYPSHISFDAANHQQYCYPASNLLRPSTMDQFIRGHFTSVGLFSIQRKPTNLNLNSLIDSGYAQNVGSMVLLTNFALLNIISGFLNHADLRPLNLYPLPSEQASFENLLAWQFISHNCVPTAFGLTAIHSRYISRDAFSDAGCQFDRETQLTIPELSAASYIYGNHHVLTSIGFASILSGYLSVEYLESLNLYPFSLPNREVSDDDLDNLDFHVIPHIDDNDLLQEFTYSGFINEETSLLTHLAYQAIKMEYFTIEFLRSVNLWPCQIRPTMAAFVTAGYMTVSGHLTQLGVQLLGMGYFEISALASLGSFSPPDSAIFGQAGLHSTEQMRQQENVHVSVYRATHFQIVHEMVSFFFSIRI